MRNLIFCALFLIGCKEQPHQPQTVQITENKTIQLHHFANIKDVEVPEDVEKDYLEGILDFEGLGMNDVPVLDQGSQGTCVTFSTTAALDALIGQGDFISQQCSLELDMGLGQNYWNGAMYPSQIINPLQKYGIVSKEKCPRKYPVPYRSMLAKQYAALADDDASEAVKKVQINYIAEASLLDLKKAIDAKHRVLIGFRVNSRSSEGVKGFDITIGDKKYTGGLWACKQGSSINHCVASNAGHEVVVIGYDDDQQLLKIRNSWNTDVGYEGNYYMTYQFFQSMAEDQTEIW